MDDFVSNNVGAFAGHLLLCDSYVARLYPEHVAAHQGKGTAYSFTPELAHIDQLGFKLTTVFRLGRVTSIHVLTKDGSPHSLQIPLIVQEAAENTKFSSELIRYFVVERGFVHEVSHRVVRAARHLSELGTLLSSSEATPALASPVVQQQKFSDFVIPILIGGRCDVERVSASGIYSILNALAVRHETTVISSEQNPEELRTYCRRLAGEDVAVVICIAGSVPGLPAAVKAHLPAVPVIGVPLSVPEFDSRDILLASLSVPARRPIILSGLNDVGLKKAALLACEIIAAASPTLRHDLSSYLQQQTPPPDFQVNFTGAPVAKPAPPQGTSAGIAGKDGS